MSTGCQKKEVNMDNAIITLDNIFPQTREVTSYYSGTLDYASFETVVNIEESFEGEESTLILIEGEEVDLSGGEAGDTSFIKKIRINDNSVQQAFGNQYITLIQGPLDQGNQWTGIWYDKLYGLMNVQCSITEITDKTITTEFVPIEENETNEGYKVVTEYEVGKGIVAQTFTYDFHDENGSEPFEYKIWLSKISEIPDNQFISKYINPDSRLKPFYVNEDTYYKALVEKWRKWLHDEEDITDEKIADQYKHILSELSEEDLKSISTAKKIGQLMSEEMKDAGDVIYEFVNFYESRIYGMSYELGKALPYEEIEQIYKYNDAKGSHEIRPMHEIEDIILRAKATVLWENGISVSYSEGMPYFSPEEGYAYHAFSGIAPDYMKDYLELKRWRYQNEPLGSEGYLGLSPDEIAQRLFALEQYHEAYSDKLGNQDWIQEEIWLFLNFYINPGYNFSMYQNGMLSQDYIGSYEKFATNYKASPSVDMIKKVFNILKKNNYMYSLELDTYLKDQGIQPTIDPQIYESLEAYDKQIDDFNQILKNSVATELYHNEKVITVKNSQELIEAIASDTTIFLEPGLYLLPYEYQGNNVTIQWGEMTIKDVNNLVLVGKGEAPITVMSEAYGYVFRFDSCDNVTINNLRLGHLQLHCKAGVVYLQGCSTFNMDKSILFGCGEWGLEARESNGLMVTNTLISDCASRAVLMDDVKDATFINSMFKRNGRNVVFMERSENVNFEKVLITSNNKDNRDKDSVFGMTDCNNISLTKCIINDNIAKEMVSGNSELNIVE